VVTQVAITASCVSHGHACAFERAADALHCTRIDAKPGSDLANALRASRRVQGLADSVLRLGGYRRPAEALTLALSPRKPSADLVRT
jgi:hypothetical protein